MTSEPLTLIYRDPFVVAINKPPGMLVHRTKLSDGQCFALQTLRDQIGAKVYPVHRLDRPTSGALVFALDPVSARHLSEMFAKRQVRKTYLAVTRGIPAWERRTVDHPLNEELDKIADVRAGAHKAPQSAVTEVEFLDQVELPYKVDKYPTTRYSLLRAKPLTGRKHQIRRHLRHLGHPIIGDVTHGVGKHNRFFRDRLACGRLLLACRSLEFLHPHSREPVVVRAPLDEDFRQLLTKLRWERHAQD